MTSDDTQDSTTVQDSTTDFETDCDVSLLSSRKIQKSYLEFFFQAAGK